MFKEEIENTLGTQITLRPYGLRYIIHTCSNTLLMLHCILYNTGVNQ